MNVIYLGCNGFPFGFAEVQKQKMISKALISSGASVTIICTKGILEKKEHSLPYRGKVENINYYYSSFTAFRPGNFIYRNLLKILGKVIECILIICFKRRNDKNIAIITTRNIYALFYYYLVLRLTGYKIILSYEEFVKNLNLEHNKKGVHLRFDDLLHNYCDAVLPISSFLEDYQKKQNQNIHIHKIPALTDFDLIDSIEFNGEKENSILFCGSSAYFENIRFIIDAYEKVKNSIIELVLIIHGNDAQNFWVFDYINRCSTKKDKIHIHLNLTYSDLIKLYKKSSLLLIPLKPYERDIARFPHKISEYTASKTPILTTAVGEINYYFTNNSDAFISENYDPVNYADKIDFIFKNKEKALLVSQNAYTLGRKNFHYKSVSPDLFDFCYRLGT
jgi:glycosyltransferase involved in cell wall biosynthesis